MQRIFFPLLLLLLLLIALPACAQGVMLPPGEEVYGERAVSVGQDGTAVELSAPDRVFSQFVAGQLPPDDRSQFWLVVYIDRTSPESRLLLQDFDRHEGLRVLRDWCKFAVIDRQDSPAAEARHLAQRLSGADVPTVLLFAHPEHPVFGESGKVGWRYAFQRAGYGGDAGLLARNLYQSLQQLYTEAGVPAEQCPGPYCPQPNQPNQPNQPWQPNTPGPYQPGWNTPPLPRLDDGPSGLGDRLDRLAAWTGWGVVILAAGAAVWWLGRRSASLLILLAVFFLPGACLADPADPGGPDPTPVESHEEAADGEAVETVLYPPIPTQWEWLRGVVRSEVREAINPIHVEGFLRNTLAHLELNVNAEIAAIRRSADTIHQASAAAVTLLTVACGLNLATLAAAGYCCHQVAQLRRLRDPRGARRR